MLPIAVMPVAALMLRLGQPDVFDIAFVAEAGGAIFANLALLFAIGVAVGLSRDNAGAAGLAGAVAYLVLTKAVATVNPEVDLKILGGIISGVVGGLSYNRYYNIRLPEFLGFFAGKRFVPIFAGSVSLVLALAFGYIWPVIQSGIDAAGHWMVEAGGLGAFVFGTLNRLLIPVGLHHVLNTTAWFVFGNYEYTNAAGELVKATGDLNRFFAGDPNAGLFMTGFYPVMMFGLPAAALAMFTMARPENRAKVGGLLFGVGLTSFLTGVTEPLEFMFMFLAPALYLVHALLTGAAMALSAVLDIHHGFGFSAGLIDFVLNWGLAKNAWMLIPMGLAYAAIYYGVFVVVIKALNLKTPGREEEELATDSGKVDRDIRELALEYLDALGGADNMTNIDACITRLRLTMVDRNVVDEKALKALGAKGVVKLGENNLQVILGPLAEIVATEMKSLASTRRSSQAGPVAG